MQEQPSLAGRMWGHEAQLRCRHIVECSWHDLKKAGEQWLGQAKGAHHEDLTNTVSNGWKAMPS